MSFQTSSENNSHTPAISVVMPFYNAERYLDASISSVLNQTFTDFEFIIINDASTDTSDAIVNKYLTDSRIVYVKNTSNCGIVFNLNLGIRMAKAEIIARMDGDDICHPERFSKQYDVLVHEKIDIVGSFAEVIDEKEKIVGSMSFAVEPEAIRSQCLYRGPFLHPSVMYKKNVVLDVGMYDAQYSVCQDIDLFLRMLFQGYKGKNIHENLIQYRKHSNSTDKQSYLKAKYGFQIKKNTIKRFHLKPGIGGWFYVYSDYVLSFVPRIVKNNVVKIYKTLLKVRRQGTYSLS